MVISRKDFWLQKAWAITYLIEGGCASCESECLVQALDTLPPSPTRQPVVHHSPAAPTPRIEVLLFVSMQ